MPLRTPSRGPGAVAIFNLSQPPNVRDLVQLLGTFGQIFEVQTTVRASDVAGRVYLPPDTHGGGKLPRGFEERHCAVIGFSEVEDAQAAAANMNGFQTPAGDTIVVALVKSATAAASRR